MEIKNEITAADARKIAETGIGEALKHELECIYEEITKASKANRLGLDYNKEISQQARKILQSKGYKVENKSCSDPRESYTKYEITW